MRCWKGGRFDYGTYTISEAKGGDYSAYFVGGASSITVTIDEEEYKGVAVTCVNTATLPPPDTEHGITVQASTGGTANASHSRAAAGTAVTLTAIPDSGYYLSSWQAVSRPGL